MRIFMILMVILASGCTKTEVTTKYLTIPDHMLSSRCDPIRSGDSVSSLSKAYIHNLSCIRIKDDQIREVSDFNNTLKSKNEGLK